jgi:hypothetical protein
MDRCRACGMTWIQARGSNPPDPPAKRTQAMNEDPRPSGLGQEAPNPANPWEDRLCETLKFYEAMPIEINRRVSAKDLWREADSQVRYAARCSQHLADLGPYGRII